MIGQVRAAHLVELEVAVVGDLHAGVQQVDHALPHADGHAHHLGDPSLLQRLQGAAFVAGEVATVQGHVGAGHEGVEGVDYVASQLSILGIQHPGDLGDAQVAGLLVPVLGPLDRIGGLAWEDPIAPER